MNIQLSRLRIRVVAGEGRFGTDLHFREGLNVVRADNTAGKSSCMNSILWVLGVDGMLGPEHTVPLPHAMTSQIEDPDGAEHTVTESHVNLEVRRSDGAHITIRRQVVGGPNTHLVRVWDGPVLSEPGRYSSVRDYYVRRRGAAQEERGFHSFLTDWCGWMMPQVARYKGSSVPLYVEAVAPLWIFEQKRGWAGLQAATPGYLQIREVKKRALEYILDLDVLTRRAQIQKLEQKILDIREDWLKSVAGLRVEVKQAGGTIQGLPGRPVGDWPPTPAPLVLISKGERWSTIRKASREAATQIEALQARAQTRETADTRLSEELEARESDLDRLMASSAQLRHSIARDEASAEQARRRLAVIQQDRRRHKDLITLQELGSDDESLLRTEFCPVCSRSLGGVLLEETSRDRVMGVTETINFLDGQADLARIVIAATTASLDSREAQLHAMTQQATDLRSRIFALRTALIGGGQAVADAEALLLARRHIQSYEKLEEAFGEAIDHLSELSQEWRATQAELGSLRATELSANDLNKLRALQQEFVQQLSDYGFQSLQPSSLTISPNNYQPAHEGYDPAFESSASDVIRIIWAYLLSLQRVSKDLDLNHPGLVIFDEPRQQMTREMSFRELLRRAATDIGQVIFATSENEQRLLGMLQEVNHTLISFKGKTLQPL